MEIWKNIEDLEVSDLGNFRRNGVILKQYEHRYLYVMLLGSKVKSSHRLVAIAFIPNSENKKQINHINGIKTDNRVVNLEWCTASENGLRAFKNGLSVAKKGSEHIYYGKRGGETIRAKKVLDTSNNKIYDCLKDVVKDSIYSYKNLSRQLTGERKNKTTFVYL